MSATATNAGDWPRAPALSTFAHTCCSCPHCVPGKPRFCMSALSDPEDDFVTKPPRSNFRIEPMPDNDDSSEAMPTDAAPPLSEQMPIAVPPPPNLPTGTSAPSTKPPLPMTQAELDAEAEAIRASLTPAGIARVAADKLIEMYQYTRKRDFELLDAEGKLAQQQRSILGNFKTEVVNDLSQAVERITRSAMQSLGERIEGIARGQVRHGEDIEQLKRDVVAMRAGFDDKITALEKKIQELDDRTPRPGTRQ